MSITEEYYIERRNSCTLHLRIDDTLIEVVAYKGTFGDIAMRHRVIEEAENNGEQCNSSS